MRKVKEYKVDKFIENYGEEEINEYIKTNDCLIDEESEIELVSSDDLYNLTDEAFDLFKDEYKEYLDNISLDEEEEEGWGDIIEKWNNN